VTEASRVQKLLVTQNDEINALRNRIAELEEEIRQLHCFHRIEELQAALRPFARAEYISTGFDGNAIFARLQYAKDATETIPLAALEEARKALEGKDD